MRTLLTCLVITSMMFICAEARSSSDFLSRKRRQQGDGMENLPAAPPPQIIAEMQEEAAMQQAEGEARVEAAREQFTPSNDGNMAPPPVDTQIQSPTITTTTQQQSSETNTAEHNTASHHGSHWSYAGTTGPGEWGKSYPNCSELIGKKQSPIDLQWNDPEKESCSRQSFDFSPAWSADGAQTWTLKNNGHAAQVDLGEGFKISGGQLGEETGHNKTYEAKQFHFHWTQSEHTIDGNHFPLEMHIVMVDPTYGASASVMHHGLAVLAFLFEEQASDNEKLKIVTDKLPLVTDEGVQTEIKSFDLVRLTAAAVAGHYWRYDGSLTTPPCSESVLWTVFENTLPISKSQLELFAKLRTKDGTEIVKNNRPVQDRNDRNVYKY